MRDANGSGNVYFDDLFAHGIPTGSFVFYCANFIIGFVNLTVAPVFFYMACLKQSFHRNLRYEQSSLTNPLPPSPYTFHLLPSFSVVARRAPSSWRGGGTSS
jgi:hypothetical protein